MSTSASIRKIKIPSLNTHALPRSKQVSEGAGSADDVLFDVAKMLARKYKILPKWNGRDKLILFEMLKTKSESKCMVELYRLCKKLTRKKSSEHLKVVEAKPKTMFRELKKKNNSSKKKPARKNKPDEETQENTITEAAQRSV